MKRYFLIFNPAGTSPPAITESKRAADYWEAQGCEVEEFARGASRNEFAAAAVRAEIEADDAALAEYDEARA